MIAQTIQLALTPVFMLVAIGNIMNILSTRLGRVVDRSRHLQTLHAETSGREHDMVVIEIRLVDRRIKLIGRALLLLVSSGVIVGLTVGLLFLEQSAGFRLDGFLAGAFFVSVALMMIALLLFLHETRVATAALRIPKDYLELERKI
ncbi:MAG: DUF2721 domain-containing protein [Novosphingobium sp.]